jgi:hypothetical protein
MAVSLPPQFLASANTPQYVLCKDFCINIEFMRPYVTIIMYGADELLKSAIPSVYLPLLNGFSSCRSYSILGQLPHFLDLLDYLFEMMAH